LFFYQLDEQKVSDINQKLAELKEKK